MIYRFKIKPFLVFIFFCWMLSMNKISLTQKQSAFDLKTATLALLPSNLKNELNKVPLIDDIGLLQQNINRVLDSQAIEIAENPRDMLCVCLTDPDEALECLETTPEKGFYWFFKALPRIYRFEQQRKNDELVLKIKAEKDVIIEQMRTEKIGLSSEQMIDSIIIISITTISNALINYGGIWLKNKITTRAVKSNIVKNNSRDVQNAFIYSLPPAFLKKIADTKAYTNQKQFIKDLAELLNKDQEQVTKSWIVKLYWHDADFFAEFTSAEDKKEILQIFFEELAELYHCSEILEQLNIEAIFNAAIAKIKTEAKINEPSITTKMGFALKRFNDFVKNLFKAKDKKQ
jgi:hypothetical protein